MVIYGVNVLSLEIYKWGKLIGIMIGDKVVLKRKGGYLKELFNEGDSVTIDKFREWFKKRYSSSGDYVLKNIWEISDEIYEGWGVSLSLYDAINFKDGIKFKIVYSKV